MDRNQERIVGIILLIIGVGPALVGAATGSIPVVLLGSIVAATVIPSAYRLLRYPSLRTIRPGEIGQRIRRPGGLPLGGGMLVAFSGIDGSGKTTQADKLVDSLEAHGVLTVRIWARWRPILSYPLMGVLYVTWGWRRKDYDKSSVMKLIWTYFVLFDQIIFLIWKIWPHLLRGHVVCVDRYLIDHVVELKFDNLYNQSGANFLENLLPAPTDTFILDVPVDEALNRKDDTGEMLERLGIESGVETYLTRRRSLLLETADEYDATVVDTTQPVDQTHKSIREQVLRDYFGP